MLGRILRHEVLHSPAIWFAKAAVLGGVLLAFLAWGRYTVGPSASPLQTLLVGAWLMLALYLLVGNVRTRSGGLDLALPVPARDLWLSHVAAVSLSAAAMLAVSMSVLAIPQWLLGPTSDLYLGELGLGALAIHLGAGLVLAVVAIESVELDLVETPLGRRGFGIRLAILAAVGVLTVLLGAYPAGVAIVPLALAAVLGTWTLRRLPPAFSLFPREALDGGRPEREARTGDGRSWDGAATGIGPLRALGRLFVVVHGSRWGAATPWIGYPWVVLMGVVAGGILTGLPELEDLRFVYVPLYVFMLFAAVPAAVEQLAHLDPLPVGRKTLFALVALPSLVFFAAGYGTGQLGLAAFREPIDRIELRRTSEDGPHCVCTPLGSYEIAWDGAPPAASSPWGETHAAWSIPLLQGSRIRLYSPYRTAEPSSPEFAALQISRAVEALYGSSIPPAEIRERYLEVRDGEVVLKGDRLTLLEDYPGLEPRGSGPVFPLMMLAVGLPYLLLSALYLRVYRAGLARRWRWVVWIGAIVLAMGLLILQVAFAVGDVLEPWASRGFLEILMRELGETSWGAPAAWGLSALLLLAAYQLARGLLDRAELPAKACPLGKG